MLNHSSVIHFNYTGLGHMPNLNTSLEPEGWNTLIVLIVTTYRKWSQLPWKFTDTQKETTGCREKWQMNTEEGAKQSTPPTKTETRCDSVSQTFAPALFYRPCSERLRCGKQEYVYHEKKQNATKCTYSKLRQLRHRFPQQALILPPPPPNFIMLRSKM